MEIAVRRVGFQKRIFGKRENWIRVVRWDTLYTRGNTAESLYRVQSQAGRKGRRREMKRESRRKGRRG